jgi:outer membrane autotransporter protein
MRRLTQFVLASSCLIGLAPIGVYGIPQNINAAAIPLDATGEANGVNFTVLNATVTVADGQKIGATGGESATVAGAFNPEIIFKGSSIVNGTISAIPALPGAGNRVTKLELQGGAGKTVTLSGDTVLTQGTSQVNFTSFSGTKLVVNGDLLLGAGGVVDFGAFGTGSTVTFASGSDFSGQVDTGVAGTGSIIFLGTSTVSDGLLGANNSLLDVQLGSGTVYLNKTGTHQANTFKFTTNTGSNALKIATLTDLTGNVDNTSGTASRGSVLFEGSTTIAGDIGTTNSLSLLRMSDVNSAVTLNGNVIVSTIQLANTILGNQNAISFTSPATSTVSTNIITAADGIGIVDLDKVATFNGNIGSSTLRLNQVRIGATNDIAMNGNIHVNGGVEFLGDKTLTIADGNFINGSVIGKAGTGGNLVFAGSSQSYGILGATNNLTSVSFNGGTFNLYHDINATDVNVKNNATLVFNQATKLSNNLTLDATGANVQLGTNVVTIGGNLITNNNTNVIGFDLASPANFGQLVVTNIANINAPVFQITTSGYIPNNTDLKIVTAGIGINELNAATLENTSTLLSNFTLTKNANDITLTVTRNTNTSIADYPFTLGVAGALDVIQNTPALIADPDIFAVVNELDNFVDRANYNKALATLAPSVDGDNSEGLLALTRMGVETIRERLDSYRLGQLDYLHTGYSAGSYNPLKDYGVWVKLLAGRFKQGEYSGIEGYKADIWGVALGLDYTSPDEQIVYGMGFNYANTESLSRADAGSENNINSYSLSLYGTYNFPNPWYIDGILFLSLHNYDQNRKIKVGAVSGTANGDYNAWQISARVETGFVYQYNKVLFQPILGVFYSHIDKDSYTETGSSNGINLVNQPRDLNSLRLAIGPKISSVLGSEGASIIPELHAYFNYEIVNDKEQFVSNFVVGGPTFQTYGIEPRRNSYVAGMGLAAYGFENISCHVNLDYEFNDTKFKAFLGSLKFKYTW